MTPPKASGVVAAIHPATATSPATVDVNVLGGRAVGLRYPAWYTPKLNDLVVVDWLGSQPFVSTCFF